MNNRAESISKKRIATARKFTRIVEFFFGLRDGGVVLRLTLRLNEFNDLLDLLLINVCAVHAHQLRISRRKEKHIALAEKILGTVGVDDRSRVNLAGNAEGNSRWKI